ncbi:GIY-YIG nuclease family protein [Aeromonas salmonicida]|uniref:GIY-YIG nuclease family protein n=1 Tax=Aeromonas salmonicida TaxID=645 RepID=UPI003D31DD8C
MSKLIRKIKASVFTNLNKRLVTEDQTLVGYANPENQYDGIDTKLILKCNHCNKIHHMTYRAFVSNKQGCSECQGSRPAVLYMMKIHDTDATEAIKIGVTSSLEHRIKDIANGTKRKVELLWTKEYLNKSAAMKDEAKILKAMNEFRIKLSFTTEAVKTIALDKLVNELKKL